MGGLKDFLESFRAHLWGLEDFLESFRAHLWGAILGIVQGATCGGAEGFLGIFSAPLKV